MSEVRLTDFGEVPALELRIYLHGVLLERHPCESEIEAAELLAAWENEPGIRCVITDLSAGLGQAESEELDVDDVDAYPPATNPAAERAR
jgi:hypothetical protein